MDRAFERMATWLRRPALYTLSYTTAQVSREPGTLTVAAPVGSAGRAIAPDVGVEVILDTSGSMLERIGRQRRIDVAREALASLVRDVLPDGVPMALRTFGGPDGRCGTQLTLALAPLDRPSVLRVVDGLRARRRTKTPIGGALDRVATDLASVTGPKTVVLITDGAETCRQDPAEAIAALQAAGLDVRVNIVGFALDDPDLVDRMRGWAARADGSYFDAASADALADAVAQAVSAPFRVLAPDGAVVATGTVGGPPVTLPPGPYRVEVLTDPPVTFDPAVVPPGENVDLLLPDEAGGG
jgi:Mg-chelatase subunit ChlD